MVFASLALREVSYFASRSCSRWASERAPAYTAEPGKFWVFVGTYTDGKSKGIYRMVLDTATGKLSEPALAAELDNPSFLAVHPTRKFLYAVNEIVRRKQAGAVTVVRPRPQVRRADEAQPAVVARRRAVPPGRRRDGQERPRRQLRRRQRGRAADRARRQARPGLGLHPAQGQGLRHRSGRAARTPTRSTSTRRNRFAVVADLGLDRVFVYKFDPTHGKLTPNDPPATKVKDRSGPRHFAFHPDGKHAYVINEINCTVTAFDYDADRGTLTEIQTVPTMPIAVEPRHSTAEVVVHPSGKFLYGSNRGHDSLAVYTIEPGTGRLKLVEHEPTGGKTPRNFAVDPTGSYVLAENLGSSTIVVFRVDPETGALEPTGQVVEVPRPCCVKFVPIEN